VRFVPGKCGVFLVLPTTEDQDAWRRFAWYTPRRVPGTYGSLSWCRDGAKADDGVVQNWFELLDSWLDQPGPAGGSNGVAH
jgi:hypothetical protein